MSADRVEKEGSIRAYLKTGVEAIDGEIRAVKWLSRHSAPDVLVLLKQRGRRPAQHPLVETKRPRKSATAAQKREHERLRDAGFTVLVLNTRELIDDWLREIEDAA